MARKKMNDKQSIQEDEEFIKDMIEIYSPSSFFNSYSKKNNEDDMDNYDGYSSY